MESISTETLLQLSNDELAEVLEEVTGAEFTDQQVASLRELIRAVGNLEDAWDLVQQLGNSAEAA